MRQGQQNRRGRGRNNNNNSNSSNQQRKGQNPLTRSFESNGPDVKLRGTPAHIAEKYMSLARDAQSSGDPVLAENYLQHAEHYNRIIMAYREQQVSQGAADPGFGGGYNAQPSRMEGNFSDGEGEEGEEFSGDGQQLAMRQPHGEQPRPGEGGGQGRYEDRPQRQHSQPQRDRGFQDGRGYRDRPDRGDRGERFDRGDRVEGRSDRDRPDRDRPDRDRQDRDRTDRDRPDRDRQDRPERVDRPQPVANGEPRPEGAMAPRRRERAPMSDRNGVDRIPQEAHEQPEFLRRPVRRPRREEPDDAAELAVAAPVAAGTDEPSRD